MQTRDRHDLPPVVTREGFHLGTRVYFIGLTRGHEAIVEPADWHRVARDYGQRWAATATGNHVYARKAVRHENGTVGVVTLARVITGAQPDERVIADNGNALDLREARLAARETTVPWSGRPR